MWRPPELELPKKLAWQSRMVGAGIMVAELDELLAFANADLAALGYWWVLTYTDPTSRTIDGLAQRL
jgi:hypothetical protein